MGKVCVPHFGIHLSWDIFSTVKKNVKKRVGFLDEPYIRFAGQPTQQETFFVEDPNFNVIEINGHDETAIDQSIKSLYKLRNKKPNCIIATTIKGKGITFMENKNEWHYLRLDQDLYETALRELDL